jgi:hypothetical protein
VGLQRVPLEDGGEDPGLPFVTDRVHVAAFLVLKAPTRLGLG